MRLRWVAVQQLFALTDQQADAYSHGWDSLMAETKFRRDSARVAREKKAREERRRDRFRGDGGEGPPGSS